MAESSENQDYDLSRPIEATAGLKQGLTSYGDAHFSLFLRKVFIKAWRVSFQPRYIRSKADDFIAVSPSATAHALPS